MRKEKQLSETEIDAIVIQEADDETAWEFEAQVDNPKAISLRLNSKLIKQLKLLARLHGIKGYQTLVKKWISERVETEMELIKEVKSQIATLNLDEIGK